MNFLRTFLVATMVWAGMTAGGLAGESRVNFGTCASGTGRGIYVSKFDPATGKLKPAGQPTTIGSPVCAVFAGEK